MAISNPPVVVMTRHPRPLVILTSSIVRLSSVSPVSHSTPRSPATAITNTRGSPTIICRQLARFRREQRDNSATPSDRQSEVWVFRRMTRCPKFWHFIELFSCDTVVFPLQTDRFTLWDQKTTFHSVWRGTILFSPSPCWISESQRLHCDHNEYDKCPR